MRRGLLLASVLAGLLLSAAQLAASVLFTVVLEPPQGGAVSLQLEPAMRPVTA